MNNQLIEFKEKLFIENLLEIMDDRKLTQDTKMMKMRYLLLQNLKKTELGTKIIILSEELMFKNNPKKLTFGEGLVKSCCNSNNGEIYYDKNNFNYVCKNSQTHSNGSYSNANCTEFYFNINGTFNKCSISYFRLNYFGMISGTTYPSKEFIYQFIKLLSKNYPTIKLYIICPKYWQTEDEKKNKSFAYIKSIIWAIIPQNLLYHDLPFMKKYDNYLEIVHSRKDYEIKRYEEYPELHKLITTKIYDYIYSGNLQ